MYFTGLEPGLEPKGDKHGVMGNQGYNQYFKETNTKNLSNPRHT